MTPPLADAWAKWTRGHSHAQAVRSEITAWVKRQGNTAPFEVEEKIDLDEEAIIWRISRADSMPVSWALIIGDVLTNYRAALDYLAWHLVQIGTVPNPPNDGRDVYFPIYSEETGFNSAVNRRLPGVSDTFRTMIQDFQPYREMPADPEKHPLSLLGEISRKDKHRQLQLAFAKGLDYRFMLGEISGFQPYGMGTQPKDPTGLLKVGTEVMRIPGQPTGGETKINYSFQGAYAVAFEDGTRVVQTLIDIGANCGRILTAFEPLL